MALTAISQGASGNFLAVQWLGIHAFTAEGTGSVPGQGTKILQAVQCGQKKNCFNSVLFSRSVVSDFATHEPQHTRPPCLSSTPRVSQTHVHWVGDAIQPSHPLSSPSPPALNLSQHRRLFKWVSSSHQVAKVLGLQLRHQSLQWIFRVDSL